MNNFLSFIRLAIRERFEEWQRERFIRQCEKLVKDTTLPRERRRVAFAMMAELIRARSPRLIRRLEVRKFGRNFH